MTNAKVTLPREVAEAIEKERSYGHDDAAIVADIRRRQSTLILEHHFPSVYSYDVLMQALVNGYEVEKSPEEKVREYYVRHTDDYKYLRSYTHNVHKTMVATLNILGITIEGVND